MENKPINRIRNVESNWNPEKIDTHYKKLFEGMEEYEMVKDYSHALINNNLAYEHAFSLYLKGINKPLQLQRLEDLIKKSELYLEGATA